MRVDLQKIAAIIGPLDQGKNGLALYQSIYNALKEAIVEKRLPENCELPATRALAQVLGISRSTVVKTYDLLKIEGYLQANMGSSHIVKSPIAGDSNKLEKNPTYAYASISETGESFYKNTSLINSIDDKGIAFRPGVPPLDLFPVAKWKKLQNEYWQFIKASDLTYYSGAGVEALRKTIASYLNLRRNVKCTYRQVFVVGGSLQSLYLIGSLLVNPGDDVFMENPTFPNVHSVFKGLRANTIGVALDEQGINTDFLQKNHSSRSKLVHVTPSCQYPLGMSMTLSRKYELLELANRNGLYIIENDYENEINYPSHDGTPLFSIDREDRTFYLGTFNRILHPSIRIGFVVVPNHLIDNFQALIMHSHRFVSPALQIILRSFIEKKYLHHHINTIIKSANERYALFYNQMAERLRDELTPLVFGTPALHVTTLLNKYENDIAVVSKLQQNGVIAHSLSKCYVQSPKKQGLIFGYSSAKPQQMETHFNRMVEVLKP